jgi:hypothetical protein
VSWRGQEVEEGVLWSSHASMEENWCGEEKGATAVFDAF